MYMRSLRVCSILFVCLTVLLGGSLEAGDKDLCFNEFCEYYDLFEADPLMEKLLPWYANADTLIVVAPMSLTQTGGAWELVTYPNEHITIWNPAGGGRIQVDMCPWEPWWQQPRPYTPGGWGYSHSGVLVGEKHVLTAKHLINTILDRYECSDIAFVFDFRKESASVPNPDIPITVDDDNLRWCESIYFGNSDWVVITLDEEVPATRFPLKTRRIGEPQLGEETVVIGHPDRGPLKASIGVISQVTPSSVRSDDQPVVPGSSGSMTVNRFTGQIEGPAVSGKVRARSNASHEFLCYGFCFEDGCGITNNENAYTSGARVSPALLDEPDPNDPSQPVLPRFGLQTEPEHDMDFSYGPPGGPFTGFTKSHTKPYTLYVPKTDIRPVYFTTFDWRPFGMWPDSPPSLQPGEEEHFELDLLNPPAGSNIDINKPGNYLVNQVFSDITYRSFEARRQILMIGLEGFTLTPEQDFPADSVPPAIAGETMEYTAYNRWNAEQEVKVEVLSGVPEPWVLLNGVPGPIFHVLGPLDGPEGWAHWGVELSFEPKALSGYPTGVYEAEVRFTSIWKGEILHTVDRTVRFDYGRKQYTPETPTPYAFNCAATASECVVAVTGVPAVGATEELITDADLSLFVRFTDIPAGYPIAGKKVSLRKVGGPEIDLQELRAGLPGHYSLNRFFDDEGPGGWWTAPLELLEAFDGVPPGGTWQVVTDLLCDTDQYGAQGTVETVALRLVAE